MGNEYFQLILKFSGHTTFTVLKRFFFLLLRLLRQSEKSISRENEMERNLVSSRQRENKERESGLVGERATITIKPNKIK